MMRSLHARLLLTGIVVLAAHPGLAQRGAAPPAAKAAPATKAGQAALAALVGTWTGTASIPLKDTSLVLPVTYTFTEGPTGITGTGFVPGQGGGPITGIVRDSTHIRFTVTATQTPARGAPPPVPSVLEHEGTVLKDGSMEGMINLNKLPVAKFVIRKQKG